MGEEDWTTQDVIEQRIANAVAENEAKHEAHAKAYAAEVDRLKNDLGIAHAALDSRDSEIVDLRATSSQDANVIAGLKAEIERGNEQIAIIVDHGTKQTERIAELEAQLNGDGALLKSTQAQLHAVIVERDAALESGHQARVLAGVQTARMTKMRADAKKIAKPPAVKSKAKRR